MINTLPTKKFSVIAFDIEVFMPGKRMVNPFEDKIALLSLATPEGGYVLDRDFGRAKSLLEDVKTLKLVHNGAFDLQFLKKQCGICITNVWDTLIVERVLTAGTNLGCGLKDIAKRRLGIDLDKEIRGRFMAGREISQEMLNYAIKDSEVLIPIYRQQLREVQEQGLGKVVEIENQTVPVVADMELRGIGFDVQAWDEIKRNESKARDEAYLNACKFFPSNIFQYSLLGDTASELNLNSPVVLKKKLAELGIKVEDTREATLSDYLGRHPDVKVLDYILQYREHDKAIGYDYPQYINAVTGRIHCSFNQMGADTARFSSSEPNMQQVKRDAAFRKMFIATPGRLLVTADYSQLQLRLMADVSGCKNLISAFNEGRDPHSETAIEAFGAPITKEQRRIAKNANFAKIFRAGPKTLARTLRISYDEAKTISDAFDRRYPEVGKWGNEQFLHLCAHGVSVDVIGRKRWFNDIEPKVYSSRQAYEMYSKYLNVACNTPIQALEADIVKTALINMNREGYEVLLQVHDELVTEVDDPNDSKRIQEIMIEAGKPFLKHLSLGVEAHVAPYWVK